MKLKRKALRKARRILGLNLYQRKRANATEKRWNLIKENLSETDRSLLDIGCNLGTLTRYAAQSGLTALGVDVLDDALKRARRRNAELPGLAFMKLAMTPAAVQRIPSFDVILCLSVHHYWVSEYGPDVAWSMIEELFRKAHRKIFFEPASIAKKYGRFPPEFSDLNREEIVSYHLAKLQAAAGPDWQVRLLGETECLGPEPFRMLFLATRK